MDVISFDEFLEANGLDIDVDVLAIRKDAVFVINRPVTKTRMDDHVLFETANLFDDFIVVKKAIGDIETVE